jgi:hypothetical protein
VLAACGGERAPTTAGPPRPTPEAITKVSENGPVKATVKVWPPSPELGDPLYLELTIEAAPGVTVAAPFEDDGLGRFAAVGWTHATARKGDGGTVEVQTYTLEPPGSGKHRMPPLRLLVTDARAVGDAKAAPTELLTEEIPIAIAPVDPARASQAMAPPRGALPIVVGGWAWWQIALAIAGGVGALAAAAVRLARGAPARGPAGQGLGLRAGGAPAGRPRARRRPRRQRPRRLVRRAVGDRPPLPRGALRPARPRADHRGVLAVAKTAPGCRPITARSSPRSSSAAIASSSPAIAPTPTSRWPPWRRPATSSRTPGCGRSHDAVRHRARAPVGAPRRAPGGAGDRAGAAGRGPRAVLVAGDAGAERDLADLPGVGARRAVRRRGAGAGRWRWRSRSATTASTASSAAASRS